MAWREKFYERPLRRPIDEATRQAIDDVFHARKRDLPVPAELRWHATRPELTISSPWASIFVQFLGPMMVIEAELSLAARLLATEANRRRAVAFIEAIASDLGI